MPNIQPKLMSLRRTLDWPVIITLVIFSELILLIK